MTDGFDVEEFIDFAQVLRTAASTAPKKSKKFLRTEGSKLARRTKARAKRVVGTDHKNPQNMLAASTMLTPSSAVSFLTALTAAWA